jgi:hypothetical protein
LNKELTAVGLKAKMLSAFIFTKVVFNYALTSEVKNMAALIAPELDDKTYKLLNEIAGIEIPTNSMACNEVIASLQQQLALSEKEAATMLLAIAAIPSPAQNNDAVNETILKHVEPASIVEIIVWLSVLQMLHRLSSYYTVVKAY